MRKYTVFTLYGLVIALMVNTILYMIPSPFSKKNRVSVDVYTDIPSDILSDVGDNFVIGGWRLIPSNEFDKNKPVITSNVTESIENSYSQNCLLGYYSAAAFCNTEIARTLSTVVTKNNRNYDVFLVELKEILEGFEEDKTWKDIGIDKKGKIKIGVLYTSKNDIYYNIIKQQIIASLSQETELTSSVLEEYEARAQALMDKIPKEDSVNDVDIILTCGQSQYAEDLDRQGCSRQISFEPVACVPIYLYYNLNSEATVDYQKLANELSNGDFANKIYARTPSNTFYGSSHYRTLHAMDTVHMALYK